MSDDAQEWRWVGEDGVQKAVSEQQLIAELSSESLPNFTLVWRKGWLEWLPAMQVEELAWALPPGKADEPLKPRESEGSTSPPAPPLYRYPVIKRRAAALRAERPQVREPPKVSGTPGIAAQKLRPVDALRPDMDKTEPFLNPFPLDDEPDANPVEEVDFASIEASSPFAARLHVEEADEEEAELIDAESEPDAASGFDDAPPAFTKRAYGEEDEVQTKVLPSKPPPPGPTYVAPHTPPVSERPADSYFETDDEELPRIPPPPPPPSDLSAYANQLARSERDAKRSRTAYVLGGIGIAAALAAVAVATRPDDASPAASESAGPVDRPAAPASAETKRVGQATEPTASSRAVPLPAPVTRPTRAVAPGAECNVLMPATKVADWAEPSVMPSFAAIPGSSRIAVGFAQSEQYAIGITIDPRTLDRDQVFREFRKQKLVSVVPTAGTGKLQFQVARQGGELTNARTVDAATPFVIGGTENGLARQVAHDPPELLWSVAGADQMTVPRVATAFGVGHAVTFRRGGKDGKVTGAWIDPNGRKRGSLVDVDAGAAFSGTPAIAVNESSLLIAFASRSSADSPWWIALGTADRGKLPTRAARYELPPGGPGGDAIAPSVASLSGERWLIQWSEGAAGTRVVRAQVLGKDLTPRSNSLNLSPAGANAGQGAAWTQGTVAAVLFYVQNEKKSHELWGASIDCPR